MGSQNTIFITGATGLLGSNIFKHILEEEDAYIILLIRGKNKKDAEQRGVDLVERIFKNKADNSIFRRLKIINGDLLNTNLGITEHGEFNKLCGVISHIYHCAAITGFRIPLEQTKKVNVNGTVNVLRFANKCHNLRKFNYISTTFIAGNHEGVFSENDLDLGQKFNNSYEESKFEAELLVRKSTKRKFTISIFRPSSIVGKYDTGEIANFKMPYEAIHIFSLELLTEVPANENLLLNIIPVDIAARAIKILGFNEQTDGVYHIISSNNVRNGVFFDFAAKFFRYHNPKFIPIERFNITRLSKVQLKLIYPFIPYFNYKTVYNSDKTESILQRYGFKYPPIDKPFFRRIFSYCNKIGYLKMKVGRRR